MSREFRHGWGWGLAASVPLPEDGVLGWNQGPQVCEATVSLSRTRSELSFFQQMQGGFGNTHREVVPYLKAMYATHRQRQEAIPAMKMETYFVTVSEQSELSRC